MSRKNGQNSDSLLEFPCRFPVKAMGKAEGSFPAVFAHIIHTHAELWPDESIRSNPSRTIWCINGRREATAAWAHR